VNPRDRRIWKMCVGIKIPFEMHRSVGIAIHKIPKTQKNHGDLRGRFGRKARPLDLAESRSS
jgi:hypothetical protein